MQLAKTWIPRYTRSGDDLRDRVQESKRLSTAHSYWELKAEQVMNRVFHPVTPVFEVIDIETVEANQTNKNKKNSKDNEDNEDNNALNGPTDKSALNGKVATTTTFLSGCLLLLSIIVVAIANQRQQMLSELKDIQLQKRLQVLATTTPDSQATIDNASGDVQAMPPPPLHEAWMETLSELPVTTGPSSPILKVPMTGKIGAAIPASASSNPSPQETIQLIGLVQAPGQRASGIFQTGSTSSSAMTGEWIGNTGWKLKSANGDSAVISKNGAQIELVLQGMP